MKYTQFNIIYYLAIIFMNVQQDEGKELKQLSFEKISSQKDLVSCIIVGAWNKKELEMLFAKFVCEGTWECRAIEASTEIFKNAQNIWEEKIIQYCTYFTSCAYFFPHNSLAQSHIYEKKKETEMRHDFSQEKYSHSIFFKKSIPFGSAEWINLNLKKWIKFWFLRRIIFNCSFLKNY